MESTTSKHVAGELAYYDSFSGLIPCKVEVVYPGRDGTKVRAIVTGRKLPAGWKTGEILEAYSFHFVPRSSVHGSRIHNNYHWE